jgi:structural maintenance of chromosome 2
MYIKEVSIEGFKSYAQRVCLTNFDPGFNAITGLNGSGKSNILDSLCFVMGIKNLSAVRISSRQPEMPAAHACCELAVHSSILSA